ncbi:Multidrug resistance protein 1 [Linnemannia zychae]|nr:Multidrug resistance protein 1 [Linnemannia zychae]
MKPPRKDIIPITSAHAHSTQYADPGNEYLAKLDKLYAPSDINPDNYGVIFAFAGHISFIDYSDAKGLQAIGVKIWKNGGIVSAVCHGSAISRNRPMIEAVATNSDTKYISPSGPWAAFAHTDGRLVKGANPQSAQVVYDAADPFKSRDKENHKSYLGIISAVISDSQKLFASARKPFKDADADTDSHPQSSMITIGDIGIAYIPIMASDNTISEITDAKFIKGAQQQDNTIEDNPNETKSVTFWQLFRFATKKDWIIISFGCLSSVTFGAGQPVTAALNFGNVIDQVYSPTYVGTKSDAVIHAALLLFISGLVLMVSMYFQTCLWTIAAENQVRRIREQYLHAVLRQDLAWHDSGKEANESLTTRMIGDPEIIYDGIADKCGMTISNLATFIAGFIIAFARGWRLSLVMLSLVPLLAFTGYLMAIVIRRNSVKSQGHYARAGAIAEQAIISIRTVVAFGGQKRELNEYTKYLDGAYAAGFRKAIATASGNSLFVLIMFSAYALAFWYGSVLVGKNEMSPGEIMAVFMGMLQGAYALGRIGPTFGSFTAAQGAAYKIYMTIDRVPTIDSANSDGVKTTNVQGHIHIKDVDFAYPSRPDMQVLYKMNVEVKPGQTIALAGQSGSGKSTIVALIERFYDPSYYNVTFLRDAIGIVSQEPVLFNATIKQNIALGIRKDQAPPTDNETESVCKLANAHDFIMSLPQKYDTMVGERGALLSGGQKQRIAIARALIKNPKILLLDEATSALDIESERVVQDALDKASAGRSTIVVAHRLSTIMNADRIYVMKKGVVKETGTHKELLDQGGIYSDLVAKQQLRAAGHHDINDSETFSTKSAADYHVDARPDVLSFSDWDSSTGNGFNSTMIDIKKPVNMTERRVDSTIGIKDDAIKLKSNKDNKDNKAEIPMRQASTLLRVTQYMKPEMGLAIIGAIIAGVSGANWPVFSKIFAQVIEVITHPESPTFRKDANFWSLMFFVLGLVTFTASFLSVLIFELIGEHMSRRMRVLSFKTILNQEMGFFDEECHSTGALTSRLATDAMQMHDLFFAISVMTGFSQKTQKAYEQSGCVASEAITNIRTIAALAKEAEFEAIHRELTAEPHKIAYQKAFYGSVSIALSTTMGYWCYALGFWAAALFERRGLITYEAMFQVMFAVVYMALGLGELSQHIPKFVKAKQSAINIFELLDKQTTIDADKDGIHISNCTGLATLSNVKFCYPTRPDIQVLNGIDFQAQPSKTVALVGSSGCGKSTVLALFERWYDVLGGQILIDIYDIKGLQLNDLREHMALVSQEPVLFDITIGDNIRYGIPDGHTVDQEQVIASARAANIHDFVASLPDGYDTRIGEKGSQLSGGQKQRIAIARALIRNPRILLLDEATSALDSESEKLVQEAIDKARVGRTTIVIAHRLSTIQDADLILVVKDGVIAEAGCHQKLLTLGGFYSQLCKRQNLEINR